MLWILDDRIQIIKPQTNVVSFQNVECLKAFVCQFGCNIECLTMFRIKEQNGQWIDRCRFRNEIFSKTSIISNNEDCGLVLACDTIKYWSVQSQKYRCMTNKTSMATMTIQNIGAGFWCRSISTQLLNLSPAFGWTFYFLIHLSIIYCHGKNLN